MLLQRFIYANYPITVLRQQLPYTTKDILQINIRTRLLASSSFFVPTRPTSIRSNRSRWNTTLRQGWQQGDVKGWRQWMGYTKDGSNARAEENEPCEQHSLSHWVLMRLDMIRDMERDRSKQSTNGRIRPPPLSSLPS